jgi:hypothetical protein
MTDEKTNTPDQEFDAAQFGAKKKLKKAFLVAFAAIDLVIFAVVVWMLYAGISFQSEMEKYDTVTLIALKDPTDPSKQCRCIEMREGLGFLALRFGMSMAFDGPKQECGHDAMVTFSGGAEPYTLTVSTRCGYIKYPPTPKFPAGESREWLSFLVGAYLDTAHESGVDCDCID